jgi:hypothetical protein
VVARYVGLSSVDTCYPGYRRALGGLTLAAAAAVQERRWQFARGEGAVLLRRDRSHATVDPAQGVRGQDQGRPLCPGTNPHLEIFQIRRTKLISCVVRVRVHVRWRQNQLSAVEPSMYAQRFQQYLAAKLV